MAKPKFVRKSDREAKKKKEAAAADPVLERERLRLQRHELNAMEKRWMAKKEADFNKRIGELTKENVQASARREDWRMNVRELQLKHQKRSSPKENEVVRNDRNYKELELEKLTQFWTITRGQLQLQKQQAVELEARMQRVKAAHVEQVSLNTRLEVERETQTDPFGVDADCTGHADVGVQTAGDLNRNEVNDVLKQHDEELSFNAKQQAQSDYRFTVVQMEQGLREEHEEELRAIKEEKERQLEEMVRIQSEQMQQVENDKMHLKAELTGIITDQKVELQEQNKALLMKSEKCGNLEEDLQALRNQHES
ncbi:hypothetical protein M3Y99_01848900 [Aphelenchoides fujianensis]|nr:hypothetical protein M3Y99_01848900 [Aphelenchoides fujianensis]